jgi:multiple sugar transport system substrate-binding protein
MAMAKAMKEKGGAKWGISLGTKNWQEYFPFLWQNGGDVVDASGNPALNSPQAVEALTFYDSFFKAGLTPKSVPEGFDITPAFVKGDNPMFFSGPWHLGLIDTAGGAAFKGKWAFVKFVSDPTTQALWYKTVTDLPAVQAAWDDPTVKGDPNVALFGEQLKDTKAQPVSATWSELSSAINDTLEKMTTGGMEPQAAADQMQKDAMSIGVK